jgi:predicted CXXCH cytochrome family protein
MRTPRPRALALLSKVSKRVGRVRGRKVRQSGLFHLALLLTFLFCLLLFIADRERVVHAAPVSETLWGIEQHCDFEILDPQNSIDASQENFDDQAASCTGEFAAGQKQWALTAFQPTSLAFVDGVRLEARFFVAGLQNDHLVLEVFDGSRWKAIQEYAGASQRPPAVIETSGFDLLDYLDSPAKINQAAFRIRGAQEMGSADAITIVLDGARLLVNGADKPTDTPTPTALPSTTPTLTPTPMPISPSPSSSIMPTPPEPSPTPEMTELPPGSMNAQTLWAIAQECGYEITNPEMSLDQRFDDQAATCTGDFAGDQLAWRFTPFQPGSLAQINNVVLEVRFSVTGLVDDYLNLEISDGGQWTVLQRFDGQAGHPPAELVTMAYDVSKTLDSLAKINLTSVRFAGDASLSEPDTLTLSLDGIRLVVSSGPEPAATPTASITPTLSLSPPTNQAPITTTLTPAPTPLGETPALPMPVVSSYLAAARVPGDPHGDNSVTADSCSACHSGHAAAGIELRQSWPEESLCFACHSSGGSGTNVETAFSSYTNTATSFFKHDVAMTNGVHRINQLSGADFGDGNRHVECEDCHEPHYADRGATSPPALQPEMVSVSGVDPVWVGPGAPDSFTVLPQAEREYQVCLKCHSSFTTLPSYIPDGWNGSAYVANGLPKLTSSNTDQVPDQRDLAQAFNPNLASFHPVATVGRNQNIAASTFVNGWSQTSMTYCTDCHQNADSATQGQGPHGSPRLHLLNGQANYSTVYQSSPPIVSAQEVCFLCHSYQAYVTGDIETSNFREHKTHLKEDWGATCYTCHNSHGSEQQHLINFDASVVTFLNGTNSQTAWYAGSGNGRPGCTLICHGKVHDPIEYGP